MTQATVRLLALVIASAAAAATYHVAPPASGGSDANSGGVAAPWSTLQHAADTMVAGDTVVVAPGAYTGFNAIRSGSPGAPITYTGTPGAVIVAAAAAYNGVNHRSRVNLDTVSWIVVEGFEIVGSNDFADSREGVRIVAPLNSGAGHITVRDNHIHHNGNRNILTGFVPNLTIERNICHHAYREHGIYISNSADNHVVRGNVCYSNSASGLQINADGTLGGDGVVTNALIESNVFWDNGAGGAVYIDAGGNPQVAAGGGSAINLDGVRDSVLVNNILLHNHASGISLYRIDGSQPSGGNLIANNTILHAANGRWCLNIQDGATGNTVLNNVLLNLNTNRGAISIGASSVPGLVSDFNLVTDRFDLGGQFLTLGGWRQATGQDTGSTLTSAAAAATVFVDPSDSLDADPHLAEGSPAIDAGTPALNGHPAPGEDFEGDARPSGAGFDIGADEAGGPCALGGDLNGDGAVDFEDLSRMLDAYGSEEGDGAYDGAADLDGDGDVDFGDLNTLLSGYNMTCPQGRAGRSGSGPESRGWRGLLAR